MNVRLQVELGLLFELGEISVGFGFEEGCFGHEGVIIVG